MVRNYHGPVYLATLTCGMSRVWHSLRRLWMVVSFHQRSPSRRLMRVLSSGQEVTQQQQNSCISMTLRLTQISSRNTETKPHMSDHGLPLDPRDAPCALAAFSVASPRPPSDSIPHPAM